MLTDPQWADTTVLSGDVAAAIRELKAGPAGDLQVHGSGNLVRWLLANRLVDEVTLNGVTIQVYRPADARSMQPPRRPDARDIGATEGRPDDVTDRPRTRNSSAKARRVPKRGHRLNT